MKRNALRIAYLTGEYPRATDTFIQREVTALRALDVHVETMSIRSTPPAHHVSAELRRESERTFSILPCSPLALIASHGRLLSRRSSGRRRIS